MGVSDNEYLRFENISKSFPGVRALSEVSFGVREGSVHALIGENGAGKSTLLKILSGVYRADEGTLRIGGNAVSFANTASAIDAGVAVIYQELNLVPQLTVAENLYLGHMPNRGGVVNRSRLLEDTRRRLDELGLDIAADTKVETLPIAERQMVEIAKALSRNAKIIAFDEPTSSLSSREVDALFAIIRRLKAEGHVILYVSHRLEEIFEIADSATVLRDGRHVETFDTLQGVQEATLVNRMVGRNIEDIYSYTGRDAGEPVLEVRGILGPGLAAPVDLTVRKGEIVGLFGLVGAGRTELMKLIYGAERPTAGEIRLEGRPLDIRSASDAIKAGIVLCPEDRKKEGIFPVRSVTENINISARRLFSTMGFQINEARERQNAETQVAQLNIKTPSLAQEIRNLSGGNQQKVILGRWLSEDVKVILLDEPTRGIDVGAKSEIYNIMYRLAARGIGVLAVSSELPEVLGICDRIVVMRLGRVVASVPRAEANEEGILRLALPASSNDNDNESSNP